MVFSELFESALAKKSKSSSLPISKGDDRAKAQKPEKNSVKERQPRPESRKRNSDDRNHDKKHSNSKRQRSHSKKPLSAEAIELTKQLQDCSRRKRLDEALHLYRSQKNDFIRDGHHACILVDCCARCGNVEEAEKVIDALGDDCNVETNTALMKAYAHSGRILQAMQLFRKMIKLAKEKPNVRTLNTLLRGCLWTASVSVSVSGKNDELCGGVVSSEEAWELFSKNVGAEHVDVSSYEYSAVILCQALRTEDALERMKQLQSAYNIVIKGKACISGGDQASLESLAVVNIALARAYALLGDFDSMWTACQRVFSACKLSRSLLEEEMNVTELESPVSKRQLKKQQAVGGKRAWKKVSDEGASQRKSSNNTYRNHRLTEMENEAKELVRLRKQKDKGDLLEQVRCGLLKRLFYFGGGGTTDLLKASQASSASVASDFSSPLWYSFGLAEVMQSTTQNRLSSDTKPIVSGSGKNTASAVGSQGTLVLNQVFDNPNLPIDVEIGAGFGDWIVRQTSVRQDRNHIAVELRADRVAQIFAKGMLGLNMSSSKRLCVVGSDAGSFLAFRLPQERSISTFFANHPEPPTQTFGENQSELGAIVDGGSEPAHMLNSATMISMAKCLKTNGRIVIVTDNRWYARLLSMTALRALLVLGKEGVRLKSESSIALSKGGFRKVETFSSGTEMVELLEGQPNEQIGHIPYDPTSEGGASYFDRLWRSGGGSHAERKSRFVLVLRRIR
ncbi:hypothetical protein FisN_1Lh398 [Fistulifera solaris]|uniref:tRNA (guanine(46)-N(7))-methyltransferase n=1 Tax=Fistulifera solaris TaxID=1519565 RepID=A0A1Z5K443_FISSO|nr:hypothetical protein FisN_1Lh398 [Fistulifera solaris]|eukprot:GAX20942.1 hypothetical protein FisN_1Lh398 [Fistulifera solaris]